MPADLITSIGLAVTAAFVLALAASRLRQSPVLAYILAGALLGPGVGLSLVDDPQSIEALSEIGLMLMLFMIGLEIDLKQVARIGPKMLVTGVLQFPLCVALGIPFYLWLGYTLGRGEWEVFYLAVVAGLSSTTMVVKLLSDNKELDTVAARITMGVLVIQDLWAVAFLTIQPNLNNPHFLELLRSLGQGVLLVLGSFLASRYILPQLFRFIAKDSHLMLVTTLAWCFLIAGLARWAGLSAPIGGLIAGAAISTSSYNREVIAKVLSVRDFFIVLFFMALGMKISSPTVHGVGVAIATFGFMLLSRFVTVFPILWLLRSGHRVSTISSLYLTPTCEISLIIASVGLKLGHISEPVMGVLIYTWAIAATISTYMIPFGSKIHSFLYLILRWCFRRIPVRDLNERVAGWQTGIINPSIVFLGFYRVASSLVDEFERRDPRLLKELLVIDFNPEVHQELVKRGIRCVYGDIANTTTLQEAGVEHAKVVLSTIPDAILKGIDNLRLIRPLRRLCAEAKIVVTAETIPSALEMYKEGADYVLLLRADMAGRLANLLFHLGDTPAESYREQHIAELTARREVIP